jgi:SAM-dependent methyltransferase
MQKGNEVILRGIKGDVLEVGAGDGARKLELLAKHKGISRYVATDYSSWDGEFEEVDKKVGMLNSLGSIFFGYRKREPLDKVCSAMELAFDDAQFDHHLSFEVLEHISDPQMYFKEASRVLKSGGTAIMSVPFLYRMHGGEPDHKFDHFRYLNGFFYTRADANGLEVDKIYTNTGYGTTMASMTNQWVIRRIMESNVIAKAIFFILSPFIFAFTNVCGFLIDLNPDKRFATRFHVVLRKK